MIADKRGGGYCFSNNSSYENSLILKAIKSDDKAFESLMGAHLKVIYNYVCIHIDSDEDIKDVIQETMLAVWSGLKSFRNDSSFRTWVMGIARRKMYDFYRSKYKTPTVSIFEEKEPLMVEEGPDKSIEAIDLNNAVTSLNKKEQELVFLAFNAQLTYQEISEVIQIPVGTVKSRMSNIKSKLKKQLEKE